MPTALRNSLIKTFLAEARETGVRRNFVVRYVTEKLVECGVGLVGVDVIKKINAAMRPARDRNQELRADMELLKANHARLVAEARRGLNMVPAESDRTQ